MRIAICDDDAMFSEAFASLLAQRGHDVVSCAPTPAEALVAGRQFRPDVFLVDLHFPDVHGVDAVKLLRAGIVDAPIVVLTAVVLTSESDAELLRQALDAGADGVVLKSEGVTEIEQVILQVRLCPADEHPGAPRPGKVWSRQARALAQRQARIVEDRDLTPRERQVIALLVQGKSTKAIAAAMNVGKATLHAHLQHLFIKLGVHSRLELVADAMRRGIVHMESADTEHGGESLIRGRNAVRGGGGTHVAQAPGVNPAERSTNTRRKMMQTGGGSEPLLGSH